MLRMKKDRLINFICLLAVYKKLIGTGRVLGTSILRYGVSTAFFLLQVCSFLVLRIFGYIKHALSVPVTNLVVPRRSHCVLVFVASHTFILLQPDDLCAILKW